MTVKMQIDQWDNYVPYPEYLKLLVRATDATATGIRDFSGYGRVATIVGNTTGSTSHKKINPHSIYFDGNGDYLTIPASSSFNFGTQNWTILVYVNASSITGDTGILYLRDTTETQINLAIYQSKWYINYGNSGGKTPGDTLSTETWYQVVMTKSGDNIYTYQNGTLIDTYTGQSAISFGNSTVTPIIGAYGGIPPISHWHYGYIDELAIWNGIAIPISQLYPQYKPFSFRRA